MKTQIDDLGKVSVTVEEEDHSICRPYSENTIVVDSDLGVCCISLRPVPPGIPITDTRFWKCITTLEKSIMLRYRKLINEVKDLKQIVNSLIQNSSMGTPFSNVFGNSEIIGMSQKAITDNFAAIRKRLCDLEGTNDFGFVLNIVPKHVEKTRKIKVDVLCNAYDDIFDSVKIYFNGELKIDEINVTTIEHKFYINKTTEIRAEIIIDGSYYVQTETILCEEISE